MIEIRWITDGRNRQLEYRFLTPSVDAGGSLCPPGEWSNWKPVPEIDVDDASYQDLIASGGIAGAP